MLTATIVIVVWSAVASLVAYAMGRAARNLNKAEWLDKFESDDRSAAGDGGWSTHIVPGDSRHWSDGTEVDPAEHVAVHDQADDKTPRDGWS